MRTRGIRKQGKSPMTPQAKEEIVPITQTGSPDFRLAQTRHDPALVVGQRLLDAVNSIFQQLGEREQQPNREETEKTFYPEGVTTGRADMRLAATRHDPKLVAMQLVVDRVGGVINQIAINKGLIEGTPAPLLTLEQLFEVEFLDAVELAGEVRKLVPEYEMLIRHPTHRVQHEDKIAPSPESAARAIAPARPRKAG